MHEVQKILVPVNFSEESASGAPGSKTIFFRLSDGASKVAENDFETSLPRASEAALFRALASIWNNPALGFR